MQMLKFEPSWDKALSNKDRREIENIFQETCRSNDYIIRLSLVRQTFNHRGELLVTVLVHNFTQQVHTFNEKKLVYIENKKIIAEHTFILQSPVIKSKESMPWTFIFPVHSLKNTGILKHGQLKMI